MLTQVDRIRQIDGLHTLRLKNFKGNAVDVVTSPEELAGNNTAEQPISYNLFIFFIKCNFHNCNMV